MSADEIFTSLLENFDNYLQDTILGEEVELALDGPELILAERQGFTRRVRKHFKAPAIHLIKKCPISSKSRLEVLRGLDPTERKELEVYHI